MTGKVTNFTQHPLPLTDSYRPTLAKDIPLHKRNSFVAFLKKIWDFVKNIFIKIGNFFKRLFQKKQHPLDRKRDGITPCIVPKTSPKHQKQISQGVSALIDPSFKPKKPFDGHSSSVIDKFGLDPATEKRDNAPAPVPANPLMQRFYTAMQNLAEKSIDSVYKKNIEKGVCGTENIAEKLTNFLRTGLTFAASLQELHDAPAVNQKIEDLTDHLEKTLSNLNATLEKSIKENVKNITGEITNRLVALLENANFPKLFKKIVGAIYDHTQAVVRFENEQTKEIERLRKELAEDKKAEGCTATTIEQSANKRAIRNDLKKVRAAAGGEEGWIQEEARKHALKAYREQINDRPPVCHPAIFEMLTGELSPQDVNSRQTQLISDRVAKFLSLLLPPQKKQQPDGKVIEIDGLAYLTAKLEIPNEFDALLQEAGEVCKELIPSGASGIVNNIFTMIKENAIRVCKTVIEQTITQALKGFIEKFILNQDAFNLMFSEKALPMLQQEMLIFIAQKAIESNPTLLGLLQTWVHRETSEEQQHALQECSTALREAMKQQVPHYTEELAQIAAEDFQKMMSGMFHQIKTKCEQNPQAPIEKIFKEYCKYPEAAVNETYGPLILDLIYNVGKFGAGEMISPLFYGPINKGLSSALHNMQKSPDYLISGITKAIEKAVHDQSSGDKLAAVQKERDPQALQKEIKKTACLAYDLLHVQASSKENASEKNSSMEKLKRLFAKGLTKVGCWWFLNNDPSKLELLISTVYHKVLGNPLLNENLLVRVQDEVIRALEKSNDTLINHQGMKSRKVDQHTV